jgi:hypothetical protein
VRRERPYHVAAALAGTLCCCKIALGAGCGTPVPVRFERGSSAADIRGAIPAGMPDCYVIEARAGQRMVVEATSPDGAAVVQIYSPPGRYTLRDHGVEPKTKALPGAEEGHDVSRWSGKLNRPGVYLIVVNRTWGGGEYYLHVEIN